MKKWAKLLVFACIVATLGAFAAACSKDEEPVVPTPGAETGIYYCDTSAGEYTLTLTGGNQYTLWLGGEQKSGAYALADGTFTFTPSAEGYTLTATAAGDTLQVTLDGKQMLFRKKVNYSVTFDSQGGSEVASQSVVNGKNAVKPADPVKAGYGFVGWYADAAYTSPFAFDAAIITENVTLYAKWAEKTAGQEEFTVAFDLNYAGAPAVASVSTVGGKLYGLPVAPSQDGYTFTGWYISQYNDVTKPSYQVAEGAAIGENVTVFAAWTQNAGGVATPVVNITDTAISWNSVESVSSYVLDIATAGGKKIVDAQDVGAATNYTATQFSALPAGDYVVTLTAKQSGGAQSAPATLYYKNKALARVSRFEVSEPRMLLFNAVANAQRYIVSVTCGDKSHNHTSVDNGSSTYYNFINCAMKTDGIHFEVTAKAEGYLDSTATFDFDRTLAAIDAFRLDESTQTLYWDAVAGATDYVVTVGNEQPVNVGTKTSFSLKNLDAGTYDIKVQPKSRGYNSPAASTYNFTKSLLATPSDLRIIGNTLSFTKVAGATGYEISIGGTVVKAAQPAEGDVVDVNVYDWINDAGTEYTVRVRATGASANSPWSDTLDVRYYTITNTLQYKDGLLTWQPVAGAVSYNVSVNGYVQNRVSGVTESEIAFTRAGVNTVSLSFNGAGGYVSGSVSIDVRAYALTMNWNGETNTIYKAVGDKISLPTEADLSEDEDTAELLEYYTFSGWYNAPTNGGKFDDTIFRTAGNMSLYGNFAPRTFTITCTYGANESGSVTTKTLCYGDVFDLGVPTHTDKSFVFGGWYNSANNRQVTDLTGLSGAYGGWSYKDATVYAYWKTKAFDFTLSQDETSYTVSCGESTEQGVSGLRTLTIPAEYLGIPVTVINGSSFANADVLEVLNIPDTVQEINTLDSLENNSLQAINIYDTGAIAPKYFSADGALYEYEGEGATRTQRLVYVPIGKQGTLRLPDTLTEIASRMFYASNLEEVIIPAGVTVIGEEAFKNSHNLRKVTFETDAGSPLTISKWAFAGCTSLTRIDLPSRLDTIDLVRYRVSNYSSDFQDVTIKNSSDYEDCTDAFYGCVNLAIINVTTGGKYKSIDGILYEGTTLLYCPMAKAAENYTIDAQTTKIADGAFLGNATTTIPVWYGNPQFDEYGMPKTDTHYNEQDGHVNYKVSAAIKNIIIPASVTEVGECAFYEAQLQSVTFAGSVFASNMELKRFAFRRAAITSVSFAENSKVQTVGVGAFHGTALKNVELPTSVTDVQKQAFGNCEDLETISFAATEEFTFGEGVFKNCKNLTAVHLPKMMTSFPGFADSNKLAILTLDSGNPHYVIEDSILYNITKTELLFVPKDASGVDGVYTMPSSVATIATGAFRGNTGITELTISESVLNIDSYTFAEMTALTTLRFASNSILQHIGSAAFKGCELLSGTVTLPNTLCDNLSDRIYAVGSYAFQNCGKLEHVIFAEGNANSVSFSSSVFRDCASLQSVILPAGINISTSLNATFSNQFFGCYNLESIEIRTQTGVSATDGYGATWSTADGIVYYEDEDGVMLFYCPRGKTGTVEVREGTVSFFDRRAFADNMSSTDICKKIETVILPETAIFTNSTFAKCPNVTVLYKVSEDATRPAIVDNVALGDAGKALLFLTSDFDAESYEVPNTITRIGNSAFEGSKLKSITFASGRTEPLAIGARAFYNLQITRLDLPDVKEIGKSAFYGCRALTTVTFGANSTVTTISDGTFYNCSSMQSLVLPASVTLIECIDYEGAFAGCTGTLSFASNSKLQTLGEYAFRGSEQSAITLPNSLKNVGDYVFYQVENSTRVCFTLTEAEITDIQNEKDGEQAKWNWSKTWTSGVKAQIFYGCAYGENGFLLAGNSTILVSVPVDYAGNDDAFTVPTTITKIAAGAFTGCTNLTSLVLHGNVTSLGVDALEQFGIENISVTGDGVCKFDNGMLFVGNTLLYVPKSFSGTDGKYTLPNTVTEIPDGLFRGNTGLRELTFAKGTQVTIGDYAFAESALTKIELSDVVSIGDYTFYNCKSLQTVTFGTGSTDSKFTTPTQGMFVGCSSMQSIKLPLSVTTISDYGCRSCAFVGCTGTLTFAVDNNGYGRLTKIEQEGFCEAGLAAVSIPALPQGATLTIESWAFEEWTNSNGAIYFLGTTKPSFNSYGLTVHVGHGPNDTCTCQSA